MTLLDVVQCWVERHGLDVGERAALAGAVISYVDDGVFGHFEAPPPRLLAKVGARTLLEAARRVVMERLLGDSAPLVGGRRLQPKAPSPPISQIRQIDLTPRREKAIRRCSICRELGHRIERCPVRIARGEPILPRRRAAS